MDVYERIKKRHPWGKYAIVEASMGLNREAGEVEDLVAKSLFEEQPIVPGALMVELSDVWHYLVMACAVYGITLEQLGEINRVKLMARDAGIERRFDELIEKIDPEMDVDQQINDIEDQMEMMRW